MPILATLLLTIAAIFAPPPASPPTTPQPDTAAWDRLTPASQKYLEKVAGFYCIDDSNRLWYRKIAMEDEDALSSLTNRARESRLAARAAANAPAWYCLDNGNTHSGSDEGVVMAAYNLNKKAWASRKKRIIDEGYEVSLMFILQEEVDHNEFLGLMINDEGELKDAVLIDPRLHHDDAEGTLIFLKYGVERLGYSYHYSYWKNGEVFTGSIARYVTRVDRHLDAEFPIESPISGFSKPSPPQLAKLVSDRHIAELPEWRFTTKQVSAHDKRGEMVRVYEWHKRSVRLRFVN